VDGINEIIVRLGKQREAIDRAITALREVGSATENPPATKRASQSAIAPANNKPKRKVSAAARRRMSEGQKRRYAALRGESAATTPTTKKAVALARKKTA